MVSGGEELNDLMVIAFEPEATFFLRGRTSFDG